MRTRRSPLPWWQSLRRASLVAAALTLLAACAVNPLPTPGGDTAGSGSLGPGDDKVPTGEDDSVAPPLAGDVSGGGAADGGGPPPGACGDEALVALDDLRVAPVPVTSGEVVMDCCSGFFLRFHAGAAAGVDVTVTLVVMGAGPFEGAYDLAALPEGVGVTVRSGPPDGDFDAWATFDGALAGTLSVRAEGAPAERWLVSLCLSGERAAAGDEPGGFQRLRLGAAEVGLLVPWGGGERGFALHLLADPAVTAAAAAALPLADLALAPQPLIDLNHVDSYAWARHRVALAPWWNGEIVRNTLPAVGPQGLPFVVTSGDERLYLGAFWTMESSGAFAHPVVVLESITRAGFAFEPGYPGPAAAGGADPRPDPRLRAALARFGKLVE
jgi:hypothetical protein